MERMIKVIDLKPGDMVDLESDQYSINDITYQYEYGLVCGIIIEADKVAIEYNNGDIYDYPLDHELLLVG